jgi:hypothetical protein
MGLRVWKKSTRERNRARKPGDTPGCQRKSLRKEGTGRSHTPHVWPSSKLDSELRSWSSIPPTLKWLCASPEGRRRGTGNWRQQEKLSSQEVLPPTEAWPLPRRPQDLRSSVEACDVLLADRSLLKIFAGSQFSKFRVSLVLVGIRTNN